MANGALRWVPFFFVTLEAAFDTTTATLAAIIGFGEMAGLTTLVVGPYLDRGRERLVMSWALVAIAASGLIALLGSVAAFAVSFTMVIIGAAHITVAGHSWISARVPFERRARFIGVYETSWAMGLLVGAPTMALLITWFGWRGPFIAISVSSGVTAVVMSRLQESPRIEEDFERSLTGAPLTRTAWYLIGASATVAMAGLGMIVVVGTWLDDALGVSTGGIGLIAVAFGIAELGASSGSAAFADRLGKRRTSQIALVFLVAGLGVIALAGTSLWIAGLGLLLFFPGFEYGIVTSFSLVSEAMPAARGRALATSNAVGTVARGAAAVAAGVLYEQFGIGGPATLSAVAAVLSFGFLTIATRETAHALT